MTGFTLSGQSGRRLLSPEQLLRPLRKHGNSITDVINDVGVSCQNRERRRRRKKICANMMLRAVAKNKGLLEQRLLRTVGGKRGTASGRIPVAAMLSNGGGGGTAVELAAWKDNSSLDWRGLALAAAAASSVVLSSYNDNNTTNGITTKVGCEGVENPMWPSGVADEDVEAFVNDVLKDSTINMSAVPDAVEKQIYKTTVRLTLNVLYQVLSKLHGVQLFGHEFQLTRKRAPDGKGGIVMKRNTGVDDTILEQVADRLLANPAINQTFLPDVVERQLYCNCLKLVFGLLDTLVDTFRINLCGHDLKLHFEPSRNAGAISSLTDIDMDALKQHYISQHGPPTGVLGGLIVQLHASLYALILGIVDDLLANSEIELLAEDISIDVVKSSPSLWTGTTTTKSAKQRPRPQGKGAKGGTTGTNVAVFAAGVGVGAAAMMLAGRP